METKTAKKQTSKNASKQPQTAKKAIPPKEAPKTEAEKEKELKEASAKVDKILGVSAENRIKKLETFGIISEKYNKLKTRTDDLTNFRAGNDQTKCEMKFSSQSGYTFTISNSEVVEKVLDVVEGMLFNLLDKAENEVLNFKI